jgi:hypothetical protein
LINEESSFRDSQRQSFLFSIDYLHLQFVMDIIVILLLFSSVIHQCNSKNIFLKLYSCLPYYISVILDYISTANKYIIMWPQFLQQSCILHLSMLGRRLGISTVKFGQNYPLIFVCNFSIFFDANGGRRYWYLIHPRILKYAWKWKSKTCFNTLDGWSNFATNDYIRAILIALTRRGFLYLALPITFFFFFFNSNNRFINT